MSSGNQSNKKIHPQYGIFGSIEFLLSGDEIKSTGKMKEGTVPAPPFHVYA
jgi:hypothetical protein